MAQYNLSQEIESKEGEVQVLKEKARKNLKMRIKYFNNYVHSL